MIYLKTLDSQPLFGLANAHYKPKEGENKMKVLVSLDRNPTQRYFLYLFTEIVINEITDLINENRHSEAIKVVFSKGIFEREVLEGEIHEIEADLILSERNARWDLMKKGS